MRVFVGLVAGLLLGFGVVVFVLPLWATRGNSVPPKSERESVATSDAFYMCTTKFVRDRPLVIKSFNGVAKTMTMNWAVNGEVFGIEQTDDVSYTAYARREGDGFDKLMLNRVSGEMDFSDHPSTGPKSVLADLCAQRLSWADCPSRMASQTGGRESECSFVVDEHSCPRLNNGGVISEIHFQCVPADRRF
jgi:hypothetical protein